MKILLTHTRASGMLLVMLGIIVIFFPFSYLAGNVFPFNLLYWFGVLPFMAATLPLMIKKKRNHFWESVGGLVMFYLFIVWMIYEHYQSEYFKVIMASAAFNLLLLSIIELTRFFFRRRLKPTPH